jgi:hypothetical protein
MVVYRHVMHTVRVESWKVQIVLRERKPEERVYYFATEGLALLAIEWAYACRLAELRTRPEVDNLREYPDLDDGGWKMSTIPGKKLLWWKRSPFGYSAMKEYFTSEHDIFYREIIDGAEPPPKMHVSAGTILLPSYGDGYGDDRGKLAQQHPADSGWR